MSLCVRAMLLIVVALSAGAVGPVREARAQASAVPPPTSAASIRWQGPLGSRAGEPKHWYSLMASGAFRAPTSPAFDSLVAVWSAAHPQAQAVILDVMATSDRDPAMEWRSVIVLDGESSLNVYLVRAGACEAYTMEVPPRNKPRIPKGRYESYMRAVSTAEDSARADQVGIWRPKAR